MDRLGGLVVIAPARRAGSNSGPGAYVVNIDLSYGYSENQNYI